MLTDLKCSVPLLLLKTGWDSVDRLELFSTTATAEDIRWDSVDRLEMLDAIASAVTYTPPSSSVLLLSLSGRMVSEAKKRFMERVLAGF